MVDKVNGKVADIVTSLLYVAILIGSTISVFNMFRNIRDPVINKPNSTMHAIFIIVCLLAFFISMLSTYYKKPSRRLKQYIFIVYGVSVFSLNYLSITFNSLFIRILSNIKNIEVIPAELLIGNIRVATILLPTTIILPLFVLSLEVLKNEEGKKKLREFEVEALLPTVHKMDDTTIDIEICKDIKTGLPCIAPERIWYEHAWIQGGTGSGKTSNFILPFEEQLLKKKAYLTYKLKEKAHYCLKNNIAVINKPISNKWFNENFDLDLIEPIKGKEEEFYDVFKEYTIGTLKKDELIYKKNFNQSIYFNLNELKNKDFYYSVEIVVSNNEMPVHEERITIEKGNEVISSKNSWLTLTTNYLLKQEGKDYANQETGKLTSILSEEQNEIEIRIEGKSEYVYGVKVYLKGSGKIIPKNLGMTIVAPDGELISATTELAKKYGIKVHRIDPFLEEINKDNIAKFNPLKGDSPEKIGDIVASILVSMDIGQSSKTNPYFTNASVRAVRNLVILLKVAYPEMGKKDPTLLNVLECLNDFNAAKEPLEAVKRNPTLARKWGSVITYIETSFLDPITDEQNKSKENSHIGSQKKETLRAIGGITNQLDNLLSREEIRYILCNNEESIDLNTVLKKGECIAISTRQGHLGERLGRAFALFFILSLQNEVLSRYAENENPEIPHYLIIDEFPMYCNENTETFFSFARKYKCSVTIAIQNMGQLRKVSDEFGETIFTNTNIKLLLPKSNLEDRKYWSDFFGNTKEMNIMTGVSTSSVFADNPSYNESIRGTLQDARNVSEEEVDSLNFQQLYYSYTNHKGRRSLGKGTTDFMKEKTEPFMYKNFDFEPYCISHKEYQYKIQKEKENNEKKEQQRMAEKLDNISRNKNPFLTDKETIAEKLSSLEQNINKNTSQPKIVTNVPSKIELTEETQTKKEIKFFSENKKEINAQTDKTETSKEKKDNYIIEKEEKGTITFILDEE